MGAYKKGEVLVQRRSKLLPRGDGPFQVVARINDNAYKLHLPSECNVSATRGQILLRRGGMMRTIMGIPLKIQVILCTFMEDFWRLLKTFGEDF